MSPPRPIAATSRTFRLKGYYIEAVQWWENGDCPDDGVETFVDAETHEVHRCEGKVVRYYRHPDVPGESSCVNGECEAIMHEHGWIDRGVASVVVCPGNWLIRREGTEEWLVREQEDFEDLFEAVPRPEVDMRIPDAIERRAAAIRRAHWKDDDDLRSWPEFVAQAAADTANDNSEVDLYRRMALHAEAAWDDEEALIERVAMRLHAHGHEHGACFEEVWGDEDDVIKDSLRDQARVAIEEMKERQVR